MIATSPRMRTRTSWTERPLIVTGRAVCARNWPLSTSDPSGFEHRKSSARISSNRCTSPCCTERSEERRVGKEFRSWWLADDQKKKKEATYIRYDSASDV